MVKISMRLYMAWDCISGAENGAMLVVAPSSKQTKAMAWPYLHSWGSECYIDMRVRWLRDDKFKVLVGRENLQHPHVIESPQVCESCELWGGGLADDTPGEETCGYCGEYPGQRLVELWHKYFNAEKQGDGGNDY